MYLKWMMKNLPVSWNEQWGHWKGKYSKCATIKLLKNSRHLIRLVAMLKKVG